MQRRVSMPGGAGNVACNLRALGATVIQFGVVGDDRAGREVLTLLADQGIDTYGIQVDASRQTTEKQRIVGPDGHLLRVDYEETMDIPELIHTNLLTAILDDILSYDAIIIADYAKGVITKVLADQVLRHAREATVPVIVDTKPTHSSYFDAPALVTPNHHEAIEIADSEDITVAGERLRELFKAPVLVTCGADGMTLFSDTAPFHLDATSEAVVDVSGAGDTVTAGAALALAAGASLHEAASISAALAGIAVGKEGTATVTSQELEEIL
jgi:D-beta-D-heptose 7-phosphate kinase/D-beta-D-heptose 1-phosphate adenosyltransferase